MSEEKLEENVNSEPETFIVQNRTPGPHFVSDIKLNFDPEEVIDLTWEDPRTIKSSKDLRNSLRMGYLKKISQIEWDGILERQAIKDRNEILKQNRRVKTRKVTIDDKEFDAESINPERPYKNDGTVSTTGYANDPLSYVTALDIAQKQAELRGGELTVAQFKEQVSRDSSLVPRLLSQYKHLAENSSVSGDDRKGRAFVAYSPDDIEGTRVAQVNMRNINRDMNNYEYDEAEDSDGVSDDDEFGFDSDMPVADVIDLESDGNDLEGGFRRV
jgi:hypothetical protein